MRDDAEDLGRAYLPDMLPTSAQLRTRLTIAESQARKLRTDLAEFRVVDEYHTLETEVDGITGRLAKLADENTFDRQVVAELEQAMQVEEAPNVGQLERVYNEIGLVLPEQVLKRFEDVRTFHDSVVKNRRTYLQGELASAQERIRKRSNEQRELDGR